MDRTEAEWNMPWMMRMSLILKDASSDDWIAFPADELDSFPLKILLWTFERPWPLPGTGSWGCSFAHQSPTWAHQSAKITWNSGSNTSLAYDFSSWNLLVHNHAYGKSSGWAVSLIQKKSPSLKKLAASKHLGIDLRRQELVSWLGL